MRFEVMLAVATRAKPTITKVISKMWSCLIELSSDHRTSIKVTWKKVPAAKNWKEAAPVNVPMCRAFPNTVICGDGG